MNERRVSPCGCVLIGFATLLGLILATVATFFFSRHRAASDVEARFVEIREQGEPTSGEQLNAYYDKLAPNAETTQVWLAVLQTLDDREIPRQAAGLQFLGDDPNSIPPVGTEWPKLDVTEAFLDKNRDLIEQIEAATTHPGKARFPVDLAAGIQNLQMKHLNQLRTITRMLLLDAHVRAHRQDFEGALKSVQTMFSVSDLLRDEPLILSQLVRIAIDGMTARTLIEILPYADSVPDQQLAEIQATLRQRDLPDSLRQALVGERATSADAFQNLGNSDSERSVVIARYGDLLYYLQITDRLFAVLDLPWEQAYQKSLQLDQQFTKELADASLLQKSTRILTGLALPAITTSFEATCRGVAIDRVAETLVAIRRYINLHSKIPASLESLVPELMSDVPIDPFDGKPLRLITKDDAIVVYSVGKDQVDDGGVGSPEAFEPDIIGLMPLKNNIQGGGER